MSYSGSSDAHLENLLAAVTDALLADGDNVDAILDQYNVPRAQLEGAISLIRRLHVAFVGVQPSRRFVRRLRMDLVGQEANVINRLRYLPPRVQIAAGVAIVAGFMLITRRRLMAEDTESTPEVAAAR